MTRLGTELPEEGQAFHLGLLGSRQGYAHAWQACPYHTETALRRDLLAVRLEDQAGLQGVASPKLSGCVKAKAASVTCHTTHRSQLRWPETTPDSTELHDWHSSGCIKRSAVVTKLTT